VGSRLGGGARRALVMTAAALMFAGSISPVTAQEESSAPEGDSPLAGKNVAFVLWSYDGYQQAQGNWFVQEATDRGAQARAIDGKQDPNAQVQILSDLVAEGVDGIVFQPVEPNASVNAINEVQAAGIPIFLLGYRPDPSTGAVAPSALFDDHLSTIEAGKHAGEWLQANRPGEPAKVVIFDILTLPLCKEGRMDGFLEGLTEVMGEENVEIKFRDTVEHKRDVAQAQMEDQLQRDPDFNVFTSCGADGVLGGIAALQAAGRAQAVDKVPQTEYIFTIDGTPSELELLFDPSSSVMETYTLTPRQNGIAGVEGLEQLMTGELQPTQDIVIPLPGVLLPPSCEETAVIFEEQYGLNAEYEPLACD
jgi:ABC-type sugar transport system substrate-binding protein